MKRSYSVRVLSSQGVYPAAPIQIDDFAFLGIDPFPWSAVLLSDDTADTDENGTPIGEISWLAPEEIRFFGALSLAEAHPRTNGRVRICTRSHDLRVDVEGLETTPLAEFLDEFRATALRLREQIDESDYHIPERERRKLDTLTRDYSAQVREILEAMDPADPLLHRGLYKMLVASELVWFRQFLEESALSSFISREAALELIRRKLSAGGIRFSREDVLTHIQQVFPTGEPLVEVLLSDWGARVLMTHPVSEYGEYWSPPVEAEECYDALNTLTYLYRYLLLDEVWEPAEFD